MIRSPDPMRSRTQPSARSRVPISSRASSARLGAPPCFGPENEPMAPTRQAARSAPVLAMTRAVKVEALKPWSIVATRYSSTALAPRAGDATPGGQGGAHHLERVGRRRADGGEQVREADRHDAEAPDRRGERRELAGVGEVAVEEQVPRLLEADLLGQL